MSRWKGMLLLLAGLCLGAAVFAQPAPGAQAAPVSLTSGDKLISLARQPQALVTRGSVSLRQVAAGALDGRLSATDGGIVALSPGNELWIPLRLHNSARQPASWQLQVAQPSIDEVTLFEARGTEWFELSAGDRIAHSLWPRHSRYPAFVLQLATGETRQLVLRVRSAIPTPVPLRAISDLEADAAEQRADIAMGFVLGALALLVVACLVQATMYRDSAYFLYGAYALFLAFAFASISGLAGQHAWGELPDWNDTSKSVFPLAAAGISVWLVRALCRVAARARALARFSAIVGTLVLCLAALFSVQLMALPWLMAVGMFAAAGTVLAMALWTWRRGDSMGGWVFAAHAPLIGVTMLVLLRMFGIAPIEFDSSILTSAAIGAILPLMLAALHRRSREVLAVQVRAREMRAIGPLTGLLSARPFADRVRAAVRRYTRSQHNAAVLYIRVANYPRIRETHGSAQAEQCMTRAAMILRRLMPDADSIGRVSESTMGVIFETITSRAALTERVSRLVAHGLMPVKGFKPEVSMNLLVVGNVLAENPLEAAPLQAALESTLDAVSARTRRPIRFLEPGSAVTMPPEPDEDIDNGGDTAVLPA